MTVPTPPQARVVAITSVDLANRRATGYARSGVDLRIDTSYHVGGLAVTPAVGEQWVVERADRSYYRLTRRLQTNAPELLSPAVQGQVHVGASGPLELVGSAVNVNAPLVVQAVPTAARPAATSVAAGAHIFDTTLSKPLWSDGQVWRDAAGDPA